MVGAIPGKNVFKAWISQLIGNLAAFPVTLLLLIMYDKMTSANIGQGGFMPPYLIGQGQGGAITVLVGLGIILVMPEAVKKAKEAMGAKDGIMTQFAKDAVSNAKKAWSGEGVPMKLGAKKILGGAAALPLAGAGAYVGQKYAADQAKKLGLDERQSRFARAAGGLLGAGLGTRVPQIAKSLGTAGIRETRDALMKTQVEKYSGMFDETLETQKVKGEAGLADDVAAGTTAPTTSTPTFDATKRRAPSANKRFRRRT